jgi:hypothetical protein
MTRRRIPALPALLRRAITVAIASVGALAVLASGPAPLAQATPSLATEATRFEFASLNRTYVMEDSVMDPVATGGVTVAMTSPTSTLILRGHRLDLTPVGDGSYRARMAVDFMGKGALEADILTGDRLLSEMTDEVVVPRQEVELDGRISFLRTTAGWDITAHELPAQVTLDIRSRLIGQLYTTCASMGVFLGLDCDGLDQSLSRVEVPLPKAGSVFELPAALLSAEEVARLDAYLGTVPPEG